MDRPYAEYPTFLSHGQGQNSRLPEWRISKRYEPMAAVSLLTPFDDMETVHGDVAIPADRVGGVVTKREAAVKWTVRDIR